MIHVPLLSLLYLLLAVSIRYLIFSVIFMYDIAFTLSFHCIKMFHLIEKLELHHSIIQILYVLLIVIRIIQFKFVLDLDLK